MDKSSIIGVVIAVTGMRLSEAMGLERDDVDLDTGVLTVRLPKTTEARKAEKKIEIKSK